MFPLDFSGGVYYNNRDLYDTEVLPMTFYIAQGLGVVAVILGFVNYQVKTREQILFVNLATCFCFAVHYCLLGAWTGMALNALGVLRNIVYDRCGRRGPVSKGIAAGFAVAMGVVGTVTSLIARENWYFVLSVLGLVINSYAMSFTDPNNIRKSILITSPMVLVYNCFVLSVGGAVYESVAIVSSVIGICRFRKTKTA